MKRDSDYKGSRKPIEAFCLDMVESLHITKYREVTRNRQHLKKGAWGVTGTDWEGNNGEYYSEEDRNKKTDSKDVQSVKTNGL